MTANDDLRELFRAEKAAHPPFAAADRGWSRLAADLAANVPAMPIGVGAVKSGLWLVPKWILTGLAVGFVGVGVVSSLRTPNAVAVSAPAAVVRVERAAPSGPATVDKTQIEIAPAPTTAFVSARAEPSNAVAAPAVSAAPTFDREMQLISRAKAQLDARQFALARSTLDEHAAEFAQGVFATERDALRVLVTCTQGPKSAALAKKFEAQHPGSPLSERLERACGSATPPSASAPAPAPGAVADFSKLPNGAPAPGERMAEPSTGAQR